MSSDEVGGEEPFAYDLSCESDEGKKDYKASIPAILFSTLFISEILSFAN